MDLSGKWARLLYGSLMVGVAIIVGSLFIVISTLNSQNAADRAEHRQSLIWYSAQLVVEYKDLLHAVDALLATPDVPPVREELKARFDIFWSRAMRLTDGPVGRELEQNDRTGDLIPMVIRAVQAADIHVEQATRGDAAAANRLRLELVTLREALEAFRSGIYALQRSEATQHRTVLSQTVNTLMFLMIGLLVTGISMGGLVFRDRSQLVRLGGQLERRVAERTQALARANADLRAANERLTQFNNLASHDLKEPVRKIGVFSDLLMEGVAQRDTETIDYAVGVMRASAGRAKALISNLLNYSVASDRELHREPVRLGDVIAHACESLSEQIRESAADITVIGGETCITGDPVFLEQLFQNLIANAVKFRREGETPRVFIRVVFGTHGEACRVHVRDNGIGFDMAHKAQLFEPFQRLHTRERFAGTGIGLAICAAIAQRHGWTIDANGTPGDGSEFIIDFQGDARADDPMADAAE